MGAWWSFEKNEVVFTCDNDDDYDYYDTIITYMYR